MLLPALGKARERGRRITCASNIKQIGWAIASYSDDFNDYIMPSSPEYNNHHTWVQGLIIWGYLGKGNFYGEIGTSFRATTTRPAGVFVCPSAAGNYAGTSPSYNTVTTSHYGLGYLIGSWSQNPTTSRARKVSQYRGYASRVMMLGEKQWGPVDAYSVTTTAGQSGHVLDGLIRHSGYGNFLFFDNHVEGRKPNKIPVHTAGTLYPLPPLPPLRKRGAVLSGGISTTETYGRGYSEPYSRRSGMRFPDIAGTAGPTGKPAGPFPVRGRKIRWAPGFGGSHFKA